jgi:hypothetical protein
MSTHSVTQELEERSHPRELMLRPLALAVLGPLTALAGLVWAVVQPYRVTLLHPADQGFWWLVVEPPLLVIVAGLAFHYLVARPLIWDWENVLVDERDAKPQSGRT